MILWFILVGVVIMTPETLWWIFVSRPKNKALKKSRERTRLFWSIRNLEEDIYGEWLS